MQLANILLVVLSTAQKESHAHSLNGVYLVWRYGCDLPNRHIKAAAKYTTRIIWYCLVKQLSDIDTVIGDSDVDDDHVDNYHVDIVMANGHNNLIISNPDVSEIQGAVAKDKRQLATSYVHNYQGWQGTYRGRGGNFPP